MKAFVVYTSLRIGLFLACFAVFGGLWVAVVSHQATGMIYPFIAAVIVSSALSLKYLRAPRERFAAQVEARAERATQRFDEIKAREDADQGA